MIPNGMSTNWYSVPSGVVKRWSAAGEIETYSTESEYLVLRVSWLANGRHGVTFC